MSVDPLVLMVEVDRATQRLLETAARLDGDEGVAGPSLLPGWSRGHVLAHVARNADGLTNLLSWARTGVVTPQYASWEKRNEDIEAGAPRGLEEQIADVRDSAARFAAAADLMPAPAWAVTLDIPDARQPAARVVWRRLREVEIHHVDLNAGYTAADWPAAFSQRLLHEVIARFATRDDVPALVLHPTDAGSETTLGHSNGAATVSGPVHAIAAWLIGRSPGEDLAVSPQGPLPTPPAWI